MKHVREKGGRVFPAAYLSTVFAAMVALAPPPLAAQSMPDINELPPGPGREEVFYNCYACHSFRIIKQQRLPEETWDELMDWMVEKQGMPPLSPEDRKAVVKYLGTHFSSTTPR